MTESDFRDYQVDGSEQHDDKRGDPDGYKDAETLRNLYHSERMTQEEIGCYFDVSTATINRWMKKKGIEGRSKREAKAFDLGNNDKHPDITKDLLQELYTNQRLSERAIAEKVGKSHEIIVARLNQYGIGRRSLSEAARIRNSREPASFFVRGDGYEGCSAWFDGEQNPFLVHRLAAVAWFGWDAVVDNVVHHKNGFRRDNRECNLELMTNAEHTRLHARKRNRD